MKHKTYDPPTIELFVMLKQDLLCGSPETPTDDPTFDDDYAF